MSLSSLGPNVVSLLDKLDDTAFPEITRMQAYWLMLRGQRPVPTRSQVDPRAIQSSLEYAFILERIAPGLARFRLAGSHMSDLVGMDVRGMPLSAVFGTQARAQLSQVLERVFTDPAIAEIEIAAERGIGKPPMDGRLLLLPMQNDFGDISRILGCFVTRGAIGRTPRRFRIEQLEVTPVSAVVSALTLPEPDRPHGPQHGPIDPAPGPRLVDGFSDAPADFANAPRPQRRTRPRLFVIKDSTRNP